MFVACYAKLKRLFNRETLLSSDCSSKADDDNNNKMSSLESLKKLTTVVADTGDFEAMKRFKPQVSCNKIILPHAA